VARAVSAGEPQVLRVLARGNRLSVEGFGLQTCAGVYAKVVSPGRIRVGDEARLSPATASTPGDRA
jgi:hypothetical protein